MKTTKSWLFLIESQSKDEPTRHRPINRDITNADRSLQLFPLRILPLCSVWQHLNTCASRVMQVYVSHPVALNKSRLKILAHVSLNANCFFTITAEILARSLANFYRQYADRQMNLKFVRRVSEREQAIRPFVIVKNNEFRHHIVKVVCGSTRLSPRGSTATLTM